MERNVLIVHPHETIGHIESRLLIEAKMLETIVYIYVADDKDVLLGVFSIKELFRQPKDARAIDIMNREIVTVHPGTHQERVALMALAHGLKAVPVVDHQGKLLGIVPSEVIFQILHEEHTRDLLRFAGIHYPHTDGKLLLDPTPWTGFLRRIPWLIIGLIGGVGAAAIVEAFELTINQHVLLAAFIPAIVYMADAVGTQSQTLFIRTLAISRKFDLRTYVARESMIGLCIAVVLGAIIGTLVATIWGAPLIAVILAISFFVTILLAMIVAILLPWIFERSQLDPAIASGPFATVIRDVLTLVLYFTIANVLLERFG